MWKLLYAARFVAKWEGWLPSAYLDTLANPAVWTQGYGHTKYAGPPIPPDGAWSKAKGLRVLTHDLRAASAAVDAAIKHKLTFRQRIALISFVFNLGSGYLDHGIQQAVNRAQPVRAAHLMLQYDHAGGVKILGLTRRRQAEAWLMTHHKKRHQRAGRPNKPTKSDHNHHRAERG